MPVVALLLVSAFWGVHPVVGKVVEHQLQPLSLTVWRYTLCAVCYLPFVGRVRHWHRLSRKSWGTLTFVALCWAVLYPLFYYQALTSVPPVECLLIVNTSPLMAAALAWLFLKERLARRTWMGIFVSFVGVAVLVMSQWEGSRNLGGLAFGVLAALAFAIYTLTSRLLFQTLPLLDVMLFTSLAGCGMLWAYAGIVGQAHTAALAIVSLSPGGWLQLLYIVVLVSAVAYVLYGYGLRKLPAGISSAVSFYPEVLFTALAQWLWLGRVPGAMTLVSALFILGGTALITIRRREIPEIVGG